MRVLPVAKGGRRLNCYRCCQAHAKKNSNRKTKNGSVLIDSTRPVEKNIPIANHTHAVLFGCSVRTGNALFTFQFHAVHFGTNPILATNVMNGIDAAGIKQDAFRQGRLATVNVSTNANVAQCMITAHPSFIVVVIVLGEEESVEKNGSAGASGMTALEYSSTGAAENRPSGPTKKDTAATAHSEVPRMPLFLQLIRLVS